MQPELQAAWKEFRAVESLIYDSQLQYFPKHKSLEHVLTNQNLYSRLKKQKEGLLYLGQQELRITKMQMLREFKDYLTQQTSGWQGLMNRGNGSYGNLQQLLGDTSTELKQIEEEWENADHQVRDIIKNLPSQRASIFIETAKSLH